jgi:DNA polymerase-3 subunit delta
VEKIIPKEQQGFNLTTIEGKGLDIGALRNAVDSMPVFYSRKAIIIKDLGTSTLTESFMSDLEEILSDIPSYATIIFYQKFEGISSKAQEKKLLNLIDRNGFVVEFKLKDTTFLSKYIADKLQKEGIAIDIDIARDIAENSTGELEYVIREIEKLSAYCEKGEAVTKEIVELVCSKSVDASTFDLARDIAEKKSDLVFKKIDDLFFMRVKATFILSAINSLFTDAYRALSADIAKKTQAELIRDFPEYKGKEFRIRNARKSCSRYSHKELGQILELIIEADKLLKSSKTDDRIIIEELAVNVMKIGG